MDKFIELMAFYWADWQQTAIANTRYSVVLAVTAFFIGTFILAILKSGKIKKLQQQLLQNGTLLGEAKSSNDELVKNKTNDAAQITSLQQQLEEAANNLQEKTDQAATELKQEKDNAQSAIADKDELFLKSVKEKQLEIDEINSKLIEKNQLSEQLQNELNEQKDNIAQFVEVKGQVESLEIKLTEAAMELSTVKSQLDIELAAKDELLIRVDKQEQSAKSQINRVLELEEQLSDLSGTQKIEPAQSQGVEKKQAEKEKLESEKKNSTSATEPVKPAVSVEAEKPKQEQKPQTIIKSQKEPLPSVSVPPVKKEPVVSVNTKTEKQGVTDKVLGWFSSMDKSFEGDVEPKIDNEETEIPKANVTDKTQQPMAESEPEPVVEVKEVIKPEVKKVAKVGQRSTAKIEPFDEESSFSEKLAEVADKMDLMQGKLKGFFSKNKS